MGSGTRRDCVLRTEQVSIKPLLTRDVMPDFILFPRWLWLLSWSLRKEKPEPSVFLRVKSDREPAGVLTPSGGQDGNGVEVEKMELRGTSFLSYSSHDKK